MNQFIFKYKPFFICLVILLLIYLTPAILISMQMNKLIEASNADLVGENPYTDLISNENFDRLCYRDRGPWAEKNEGSYYLKELMFRTPVVSVHWFSGAKSYYIYTYEISNEYKTIRGSWNIPVTITSKLQKGKWVVTNVFEPA